MVSTEQELAEWGYFLNSTFSIKMKACSLTTMCGFCCKKSHNKTNKTPALPPLPIQQHDASQRGNQTRHNEPMKYLIPINNIYTTRGNQTQHNEPMKYLIPNNNVYTINSNE